VNEEFAFAIRNKDTHEVFYGDPKIFAYPEAFLSTSDTTDLEWEWAVVQKAEKASKLILITRLMGFVITDCP